MKEKSFKRRFFSFKGFTLIELLVVVLIIAILTSVALPNYQKAVIKSRIKAIRPILSTLREAEEVYYLTNGTYVGDYAELDVDLPCKKWDNDKSYVSCGKDWMVDLLTGTALANMAIVGNYCPDVDVSTPAGRGACIGGSNRRAYIAYYLLHSSWPNVISCSGSDERTVAICREVINNK